MKKLICNLAITGLLGTSGFCYGAATPAQATTPNSRPTLSGHAHKDCSKHVCVHWTKSGKDRVSTVDKNHNGVPDKVETVLKAGEKAWKVLVDRDHFQAPRSDAREAHDGGNGKLDIYLQQPTDLNLDGETFSDDTDTSVGSPAYIQIRPRGWSKANATETIANGHRLRLTDADYLSVVAAHEFFHAVQLSYPNHDFADWEKESEAEWSELLVYPKLAREDVFSRLTDGPSLISNPSNVQRDTGDHLWVYGEAPFFLQVQKTYGVAGVRKILQSGGIAVWAAHHGGWSQVLAGYVLANLDPAPSFGHYSKFIQAAKGTTPFLNGQPTTYELGELGSQTFTWQGDGTTHTIKLDSAHAENSYCGGKTTPWVVVLTVTGPGGIFLYRRVDNLPDNGRELVMLDATQAGGTVSLTVVNVDSCESVTQFSDGTVVRSLPTLSASFGGSND